MWILLQSQPAPQGSFLQLLPLFAGIIAIMYFLVFRPARKQEQRRREMLAQIKKNDKVLTTGGIFGVVMSVKDDEVVLKIDEAQNVRVRVARSAVASILQPDGVEEIGKSS